MIKFPKYPKDPFEAYKDAVDRCRDHDKKISLKNVENGIKKCYEEYDDAFIAKSVHLLPMHKVSAAHARHLKSLYSKDNTMCRELRHYFNSQMPHRVYWNICPYCTVSNGNTLEHIMPKEKYPEYAIHAYNLIPCCSTCNSNKGEKIKDAHGIPEAINFFYHDPDSIEFLKVDVTLDDAGFPQFKYSLSFPKECDHNLKTVITNHFINFHLKQKYEDKAISKYCEDEIKIVGKLKKHGIDETIDEIRSWVESYTSIYGKNHYYVAMLKEMINSTVYYAYLKSKEK